MTEAGRRELKDQILAAIGTHYAWMGELRSCVVNGYTSLTPAEAAREDTCAIGIWLSEKISPELKTTGLYEQSCAAHAAFHREASLVVALTVARSPRAHEAIAADSDFSKAATTLRKTLSSWLALARESAVVA